MARAVLGWIPQKPTRETCPGAADLAFQLKNWPKATIRKFHLRLHN